MNDQESRDLFERVAAGDCTPEEKALVENWYLDMCQQEPPANIMDADYVGIKRSIWQHLHIGKNPDIDDNDEESSTGNGGNTWYLAAAAIISISILTYCFYLQKERTPQQDHNAMAAILPGTNKAILTLGDGSTIALDDAPTGNIANAQGVNVQKNGKGVLQYVITGHPTNQLPGGQPVFNTISTPRGGQYHVVLPDDTTVYLNAGSSLTYPVPFTGTERRVKLTGEAYFEVAKNRRQPFIVSSYKQNIKVTGTHFNVSSYSSQPADITTLAEGSVEVSSISSSKTHSLKPGQQSILTSKDVTIKTVDVEEAMAWKDGLFIFNNVPLPEVLEQLSRWYDVDIDLHNLPETRFDGEISRNLNLKDVLSIIESSSKVKFTIQGRQISAK